MKYIRTQKGHIYEYVEQRIYPSQYTKFGLYRHNLNSEYELIIAQADTIEELCDYVAVWYKENDNPLFIHKSMLRDNIPSLQEQKSNKEIYDFKLCILTDTGLDYIAKMNGSRGNKSEKKFYRVYCCFYGCSSGQVVVSEHIGELRLDKGHPRLYFEKLKRSCIGFECFNKIMFATQEEAEKQAKMLNDKKISDLEWDNWVREMKERKHWLTSSEQVKELNLKEIEVKVND